MKASTTTNEESLLNPKDPMDQASCPLCGSSDSTVGQVIPTEILIEAWRRQFSIDTRNVLGKVDHIVLKRCRQCDLSYFLPTGLEGPPALYASLSAFPWYHQSFKWEYGQALMDLPKGGRVLEIGCGTGFFMAYAKASRRVDIQGIDSDPQAVEHARSRGLEARLLDVAQAAEQAPGQYDAVCSFQVLEHLPSPRLLLDAACALLKAGGKLLVAVPNAEGYLKHQFNLLDMPPHHVTRWSPQAFAHLSAFYPLRLEHLKYEPLAEHHVRDYVEGHSARLKSRWGLPASALTKGCASRFLLWTGIRRRLRGHALYASFHHP